MSGSNNGEEVTKVEQGEVEGQKDEYEKRKIGRETLREHLDLFIHIMFA